MESDALMWMWWAEGPVSVLHGPMTETFAHTGTLLCWPGLSANTETLQSSVCLELSGGLIKCLALNLWFPMNLHGPQSPSGLSWNKYGPERVFPGNLDSQNFCLVR